MPEQRDAVLTNAKIVLAERVIERGWLAVSGGAIAEFGEGSAPERGEDLGEMRGGFGAKVVGDFG